MALLNTTVLSLLDVAKRVDPDGSFPDIAELLTQTNEILIDCRWKEGNLPTGHRHTIRTGLPTVYWRLLNQGVPPSKSTTAQVDETVGMLSAYSQVDKKLLELNDNSAAFRLSEDAAFLEAMNQEVGQTMFYGTPTNPQEFIGLTHRYNALSGFAAAENVLSAGGSSTDNTSIWLVVWGDRTVFGLYPKGSQAGFRMRDLGEDTATDANGGLYQVMRTNFEWDCGLAVKDWRYAVRIANVDISDLAALTGTQALTAATSVIRMMARAIDRIPAMGMGTPAFYVNRTVASHLRIMAMEKQTQVLTIEQGLDSFGKSIFELRFLGIPIRIVDQLLNNESVVA